MWEKIKSVLTWPYRKYQEKQAWKKRMDELVRVHVEVRRSLRDLY